MIDGLEGITAGEILIGGRIINDVLPKDRQRGCDRLVPAKLRPSIGKPWMNVPSTTPCANVATSDPQRKLPSRSQRRAPETSRNSNATPRNSRRLAAAAFVLRPSLQTEGDSVFWAMAVRRRR